MATVIVNHIFFSIFLILVEIIKRALYYKTENIKQ